MWVGAVFEGNDVITGVRYLFSHDLKKSRSCICFERRNSWNMGTRHDKQAAVKDLADCRHDDRLRARTNDPRRQGVAVGLREACVR
jgi:hypothetical protein